MSQAQATRGAKTRPLTGTEATHGLHGSQGGPRGSPTGLVCTEQEFRSFRGLSEFWVGMCYSLCKMRANEAQEAETGRFQANLPQSINMKKRCWAHTCPKDARVNTADLPGAAGTLGRGENSTRKALTDGLIAARGSHLPGEGRRPERKLEKWAPWGGGILP